MEKLSSAAALIEHVPAGAAGTRSATACSGARSALVPRQVPRRRRLRLQGEQLGVSDRRAVWRRHPPFRRRLAARDRGCGDDPRRAPALHASGEVARTPSAARSPSSACARFALDSEDELTRSTRRPAAPRSLLWVRVAVPAKNSRIPLERKYGVTGAKAARLLVKARQARNGARHHLPRRLADDDARRLHHGAGRGGQLIVKAGVVLDRLDVGGGFPSAIPTASRPRCRPSCAPSSTASRRLPIGERCRLMCEPGRALVAEAESLIVRVDARRGNELFINDGSYGTLFDAAHLGFAYPARLRRPRRTTPSRDAGAVLLVGPDLRLPSTT